MWLMLGLLALTWRGERDLAWFAVSEQVSKMIQKAKALSLSLFLIAFLMNTVRLRALLLLSKQLACPYCEAV